MRKTIIWLIAIVTMTMAGFSLAGPVNVNTADATTLAAELEGIGQARARAIVAWRNEHGRFESIDDLQRVKGVGRKIIDMNRANIRFEDREEDSD